MANYTAADIKELRERTGAGMLDVKKALDEAEGDKSKAQELLRIKGLKGVTKREGRTTSNGLVVAKAEAGVGTLVEVLCETDFVAKGEKFGALADEVLAAAVAAKATDAESLLAAPAGDKTVKDLLDDANATIGEKIEVKRVARVEAPNVSAYLHKTSPDLPAQIGVLLGTEGGDDQVARDVAMHIAAMNPPYNKAADVPADFVAKEKEIELAKMSEKDKAKPAEILEKIISGKINKIVNEVTLYGQPYVLDSDKSVEQVVKAAGADVIGFQRLVVGEGIEKVVEDYAAEVMKQAGLA